MLPQETLRLKRSVLVAAPDSRVWGLINRCRRHILTLSGNPLGPNGKTLRRCPLPASICV
jgi:hypothetical protein